MATERSEAAHVFGQRLRETRLALGLSQEDVADLAEMHVTNLGKIERGQANPNLVTIVRVASVLDADPAELLRGIGVDHVPPTSHKLTAADLIRERAARS